MNPPLIWVIEDNDQNFELVDFLLGEAGYAVARARDAGDLALLLAERPPSLVLLDMNLPSGSGLELLSRMRAHARLRQVPVVALTAHAMRGDRERFLAAGCDGYISKPIESGHFLAMVAGFLKGGVER
jgi:CheY-like chemotaxis protein